MLSSESPNPPSGLIETTRLRKDGTEFPVGTSMARWQVGEETFFTYISRDITQQKQAEEKLKESELQYRQLVETSPNIIITTDLKGNLLFVNKEWKKHHGYPDRKIKRLNGFDMLHPDDLRAARTAFSRAMRGKSVTNFECRLITKDDQYINVLANLSPILNAEGKATSMLIAYMDITDRKQAEEIFKTMSLRSPVGMYIVQDGKFVFTNPQFMSDLSVTEERIIGATAMSRVSSEDIEVVRQNAIKMLKGESTIPYEYRVTNEDGETRWFMETVAPIQYKGRRAVLGSVLDITERKKSEERLRETRRRFRDLVNLLPLSVTEINTKNEITFANKIAIESTGYTEEEIRINPMRSADAFIPEDRERVQANIQRILKGGNIGPQEYTQIKRDGSTYPVVTYSAPIIQNGKAVGLRTVTINVTEQKKAEQEIAEKNRELEEVNTRLQEIDRLKSIFLSSMSHELRTPLNSIIGFTSLILDGMTGDINEEQREQLTLVKSSSHHLLSLINDVLDISKIEAGKVELSLEEFMLSEVISEVIELLTPTAQKKGIELIAETDGDIQVYTDRRRIKQILINLAGNAVKFTEQGSVRITAGLHKEKGYTQDDSLEVHVIDTGIGIKRGDIDKLFAPFQQVDGSLTRKFQGTGLGLHLSKKILSVLGGDIWVKSRYGKGSDFGLILPLKYRGDGDNEENTGSG
jgi:PAS domain S-box-containing protein